MQTSTWSPRSVFSRTLFVSVVLLQFTCAAVAGADFTSSDGAASEAQTLARGDGGLSTMAFVRPVLDGVLHRAGFKGGDKWIDGKFACFEVDPALEITPEQQQRICPR